MAGYSFDETHAWDNMPSDYESTDYVCTGCDTWIEDISKETDIPEPDVNYYPCQHPRDLLAFGVPTRGPGESYDRP